MREKLLLLVLALWLCLPWAAQADGQRTDRALLVGCDLFLSYPSTAPASRNNVRSLAEAFSEGGLRLAALETRENGLGTVEELEKLILTTFADADDDDVSCFYLSTHGVWEPRQGGGSMTLLLSDGVSESGVTATELRAIFDRVKGVKVLLLDACHAGAMIGKGVNSGFENVFAGPDYVVICSSGGAEESWFWSGDIDGERLAGAGYFSSMLLRGLSPLGGYGADANHDGSVSLTELKRYLLENHGASTIRTYPEESLFTLFRYDTSQVTRRRREAIIDGVSFEEAAISREQPEISFSFNVLRSTQVAYQLVYLRQGRWDFAHAELYYDNNGLMGTDDIPGRTLPPGLKERTLTLDGLAEDEYGYLLLQLIAVDKGVPTMICSRVLCVPPAAGDPALGLLTRAGFCPENGEELSFIVRHSVPCELTVTIVDAAGDPVRRLCSRQATRPEHLNPAGTFLTWSGLDMNNVPAPDGLYRIQVKAYLGNEMYEYLSAPVALYSWQG